MNRSFTINGVTKEFSAYPRNEIMKKCREKTNFIMAELCKLTYLKSLPTHNHWLQMLSKTISNTATDNLKKGLDFDYNWFFDDIKVADEWDAEYAYERLKSKYDNIKPRHPDFDRLANNFSNFRSRLTKAHGKLGRLLTSDEIREIIESLDLYDGTQD